jgi:hypothetical protein
MMRATILAGGIAAMLGLAGAQLHAQTTVEGGVVVQSGPVTAHVEVGQPAPPPEVVYVEPAREVIVVEHSHVPGGRAHGWWKKHGYRQVTVFYDGERYYAHRVAVRRPLREIVIYQRGGRYYEWVDDDRHEEHHHGHGHDD